MHIKIHNGDFSILFPVPDGIRREKMSQPIKEFCFVLFYLREK